MSKITKFFDKFFYADFQDSWDVSLFRNTILKNLEPFHTVLDLGAGAGITALNIKRNALRICGIDIDERVLTNPTLDEAKIASAESIPYEDNFFDMVICMHVFEHLSEPEKVFREVSRVLKENGLFLIKTPNKFHYAPLLARCTPSWFHKFYNKLRGRDSEDTFATYYKANTESQLKNLAKSTSFNVEQITLIEGRPEYLRITWPTYLLGILYERLVNSTSLLRHFRAVMLACLRKDKCIHSAGQSAQQKSMTGGINQCAVSVDTREHSETV